MRRLRIGARARKHRRHVVRPGDRHDLLGVAIERLELAVVQRPVVADAVQRARPEVARMHSRRLGVPAIRAAAVTDGEVPDLFVRSSKCAAGINIAVSFVGDLPSVISKHSPFENNNTQVFLALERSMHEKQRAEPRAYNDDVISVREVGLSNNRHGYCAPRPVQAALVSLVFRFRVNLGVHPRGPHSAAAKPGPADAAATAAPTERAASA